MTVDWIPLEKRSDGLAALEGFAPGAAHRPEYVAAAAGAAGCRAGLWVHVGSQGRAACPLLVRPAPGGAFDVATPVGFSGFAIEGDVPHLADAWARDWRARGAVAAYVQLSPALDAATWRARLGALSEHLVDARECLVWDLRAPPDELLGRMAPKHRQLLRKWLREDIALAWHEPDLAPAFLRLYSDFADRRNLPEAYRFPSDRLEALLHAPGTLLVGARAPDGTVEAATLFLHGANASESFLNAATPDGRRHSRGLYWSGALALRARGARAMNLGGGVVDGDALSDFKSRLGARPVRTLALTQVFDDAAYARCCAEAGVEPAQAGRFPAWHGVRA
jgi:hypothetical protein